MLLLIVLLVRVFLGLSISTVLCSYECNKSLLITTRITLEIAKGQAISILQWTTYDPPLLLPAYVLSPPLLFFADNSNSINSKKKDDPMPICICKLQLVLESSIFMRDSHIYIHQLYIVSIFIATYFTHLPINSNTS